MEAAINRFHDLFAQLGLASDPDSIQAFLTSHTPLAPEIALQDAAFWTPSQATFLQDALQQDSDWAELADQLNRALRGPKSAS